MKYIKTYLTGHWSWYLTHPWEWGIELYKEARAFLQRGFRGYADSDVWGFNDYLTDVLAGGLRGLAKGISYPGSEEMDTWEKWQYALESNAKRLENVTLYEESGWEKDNGKSREAVYREQKKALKFIMKWFNHLWD